MKIYISGICGTGMGPLALMAQAAGHTVCGSDQSPGMILPELSAAGISVEIGTQNGDFLAKTQPDWFVYTSALPADAPELSVAKQLGLRISKRDELIAFLVDQLNLHMVAIAGTHGKTTTTGMIIWAGLQLGLPISYLIGTTLGFADSGHYSPDDKYLIYEADEYDKNFLHYHPWLGVITIATYDHPDTYPTPESYQAAFEQFKSQCSHVLTNNNEDNAEDPRISLAGKLRRLDATLAFKALKMIVNQEKYTISDEQIISALNSFPGVGRRFERIAPGIYTDYGHHPEEISATIQMAIEQANLSGFKGVVAVYEPHQNVRQHRVREGYQKAFQGVSRLYWLPTYLTREDPNLPIIAPTEFISTLVNSNVAQPAQPDDALSRSLHDWQKNGYLILLLTAGPADAWLRSIFS